MAKAKLPAAKDWKARSIQDWNAHTFYAYLRDMHKEIRGVDYFAAKGVRVDMSLIKQTYEELGKEITKDFITQALRQYKPRGNFKVCTFMFMYTYMRATIVPTLQERKEIEETGINFEGDTQENYEEMDF